MTIRRPAQRIGVIASDLALFGDGGRALVIFRVNAEHGVQLSFVWRDDGLGKLSVFLDCGFRGFSYTRSD